MFSAKIFLLVFRGKCTTPCSSKAQPVAAHSPGWIRTSIATQPSLPSLSCSHPIKACSTTSILPMWSPTPMTRSERFRLFTTRSVRSLPSSTSWLMIPRSPYLPRPRVICVSGSSHLTPSISPMLELFEKSSDWRAYHHSTWFLLWIERDWYHSKSPNDPGVFIVGPILRS